MDSTKTYSIANVRVEREADRYWLEIYLMLLDNSEHRKFQVGGFAVEVPEQQVMYHITGPTGETSIITFVGGRAKHRYTRFSVPIHENIFAALQDKAVIHFSIEDKSLKNPQRLRETIQVMNGLAQGIDRCIWIKEEKE